MVIDVIELISAILKRESVKTSKPLQHQKGFLQIRDMKILFLRTLNTVFSLLYVMLKGLFYIPIMGGGYNTR